MMVLASLPLLALAALPDGSESPDLKGKIATAGRLVGTAQYWHEFATVQAHGASMELATTADLQELLDLFLSSAGKVEDELLSQAEVMGEELTAGMSETKSSERQTETKLVQELHTRHALMAQRSQRLAVAINGRVGHGKCCCGGDSVSAAAGDLNCSWAPPEQLGDVTGRCPSDSHMLAATWTAGYGGDHELLARGVDSCAQSQGWKESVASLTRPLVGASAGLS